MMEVDHKIKCIMPTDEITQIIHSITERQFWKVNEWRAFLFHAPITILPGILDDLGFFFACFDAAKHLKSHG